MERRRKTVLLVLLSLLAAAAGTWTVLWSSAPGPGGPGAAESPARGRAERVPLPRAEPVDGAADAGKGAAPVRVPARVRVIAVSRDEGAPLLGATVRLADGGHRGGAGGASPQWTRPLIGLAAVAEIWPTDR